MLEINNQDVAMLAQKGNKSKTKADLEILDINNQEVSRSVHKEKVIRQKRNWKFQNSIIKKLQCQLRKKKPRKTTL